MNNLHNLPRYITSIFHFKDLEMSWRCSAASILEKRERSSQNGGMILLLTLTSHNTKLRRVYKLARTHLLDRLHTFVGGKSIDHGAQNSLVFSKWQALLLGYTIREFLSFISKEY